MGRESGDLLNALAEFLSETKAGLVIHKTQDKFVCGAQWGQEAEDSPMAGAAAYGLADSVAEALDQLLSEAGY